MALPKIDQVTFRTELPSDKTKITFRPFLVKEEKIFLVALESGERENIIDAIRQIITNCVVEPEEFDVDKITLFDLEHLFLQLRIKSIGEKITLKFSARKPEHTECPECLKEREVEVDLNEAAVIFDPDEKKVVEITSNMGVVLKYPKFTILKKIEKVRKDGDIDNLFDLFWDCIDYIYDSDKNINPKEYTKEEGKNFLESIPTKSFREIEKFLFSLPKLTQTIDIKCSKKDCGFEQQYTLVGLEDFFV